MVVVHFSECPISVDIVHSVDCGGGGNTGSNLVHVVGEGLVGLDMI